MKGHIIAIILVFILFILIGFNRFSYALDYELKLTTCTYEEYKADKESCINQ